MKNTLYKVSIDNNNNNKFKNIFISLIFLLIIIIILKIYLPSFKKVDYAKELNLAENEIMVLFNNDCVDINKSVIKLDNQVFISFDFIKKYIDPYIFWDEKEQKLIITNENNVIRMKTKELEYFLNNKPLKLNIPISEIDETIYLPYEFVKDFYKHFNFSLYPVENTLKNVLSINQKGIQIEKAKLKGNSFIRLYPEKKSPYIVKAKKLQFGNEIFILEKNANEKGYIKISTKDGYVGYVKERKLKNREVFSIENNEKNQDTKIPEEQGKINLVFEQLTNYSAVQKSFLKEYPKGIDVLVPTFFSFQNKQGDILNIADKSYVEKAHKNGMKVWGLITDNFDKKISHSILTSTKTREYVIRQLLAFVSIYDLDGINIDFESVPKEDGKYFIQFLRELAPLLKEQGATLSVDLFVPKPWTKHYNREEVGKIADYVIVMGYDEHYAGSKNAGSVASISWSREAIESTIKEGVPKDKLILGVPFYTRIWTEENIKGNIKLYSKAVSMKKAYDFIKEKGGEFTWLDEKCQYYAEIKEENKTYKVWLEDENSFEARLNLIFDYDIAGIGAWKLGLEKEEVWKILNQKMK